MGSRHQGTNMLAISPSGRQRGKPLIGMQHARDVGHRRAESPRASLNRDVLDRDAPGRCDSRWRM